MTVSGQSQLSASPRYVHSQPGRIGEHRPARRNDQQQRSAAATPSASTDGSWLLLSCHRRPDRRRGYIGQRESSGLTPATPPGPSSRRALPRRIRPPSAGDHHHRECDDRNAHHSAAFLFRVGGRYRHVARLNVSFGWSREFHGGNNPRVPWLILGSIRHHRRPFRSCSA
jgi:hypothetical protein